MTPRRDDGAALRSYQVRAARRMYRTPATGMLADMGTGKTISSLSAVNGLLRHHKRRAALVVMPLRPYEVETWQKEARRWSHTKQLRFANITPHKPRDPRSTRNTALREQRQAKWNAAIADTQAEFATPADVYLTTYDNLAWLAKLAGRKRDKPKITLPDILILDESSYIKNANSMRFKALKFRLRRFFKTVIILTGTPMPNSLLEMWSQIYVLDRGNRLGTSYNRFKQRFFEQEDYHGYKWSPREGAVQRVTELVQDITVRLDADDWVKMPRIVPNAVPLILPERVMHLYRQHERSMFTQLSATKSFSAVSAATLSMQCWQVANGAIYDDPEERTSWTELHTAKLEALEELIDEHPGQSIMVAYWFKHDLQRLQRKWPKARTMGKRDAKQTEEDWNAGKIPLLFVQPRSSGHALNMQYGGHIIVWFSLTWSLEAHDQLIGRLRRPDQASESILCHYLVAEHTVDEAIMAATELKDRNQRSALAILREHTLREFGRAA